MTYHTIETTSLTNEADLNLSKEESSSRRKWLGAVATVLFVGGRTALVSSSSSSNYNPAVRSKISLNKGSNVDIVGWNERLCSEMPKDFHQHGGGGGHNSVYVGPAFIYHNCPQGASWNPDPSAIYGIGWYCDDDTWLEGQLCTMAYIASPCNNGPRFDDAQKVYVCAD